MNQGKIICGLSILLLLISLLAMYGFISKGKAVPAVALIVQKDNDFGYAQMDAINHSRLWENYPYWVIMSEKKKLDSSFTVEVNEQSISLGEMVKMDTVLFLRMNFLEVPHGLLDTINSCMKDQNIHVTILTDISFLRMLKNLPMLTAKNMRVVYIDEALPVPIERSHLPYFFTLSPDMVIDNIYIPRQENPAVLKLYFSEMEHIVTKVK